nr:hypothetical protein [Pollutimonas nitritireducens]
MCKAIQLCISEQAFDRDNVLRLQMRMSAGGTEMLAGSSALPRIRQIAIPTTLATSEWTPLSLLLSTGIRGCPGKMLTILEMVFDNQRGRDEYVAFREPHVFGNANFLAELHPDVGVCLFV